ncbi:MAG: hypothetical protein VKI81_05035 [Synechococcaceae cyanobacterium]|nr:hypothetical protein [Synechococcaceae cyanobacterium]
MASRSPASRTPIPGRRCLPAALLLGGSLLLAGCEQKPSAESVRIDQLDLKIQQLEQRLNKVGTADPADSAGRPPAGPVKSLTYRTTSEGNQLRIYWADGTQTDLECNQEQATLACG